MRNTRFRFLAVPLGIFLMVIIALLVINLSRKEMAGTADYDTEHYLANQTERQNRPLTQEPGTLPLGEPPEAQDGVKSSDATRHFEISVNPEYPSYTKDLLVARPDEVAALTFRNSSSPDLRYRHSWALVEPGMEGQVITEAQRAGPQRFYIPDSEHIIARTRMLDPQQSDTIAFRVPSEPGDYPFLCTFPGHGAEERGILRVIE